MVDPDRLIEIWSYLLWTTTDLDRLARRMRFDLESWETFRAVRDECREMWQEAKEIRRENDGVS